MPTGQYDRTRKPIADRFWSKVNKNGPVPAHRPELGPCWIWTGARSVDGYGRLSSVRGQAPLKAPNVSYEIHYGPIPDGLWPLHHCDNPPCVRPDHLFLGTRADNIADMVEKGRARGFERQETCRNGHPLSGENLVLAGRRKNRLCRTCAIERKRRWRAQRKTEASVSGVPDEQVGETVRRLWTTGR